MRYFYDTEFLEDGRTIELISIGIVAEDGREYYAVNSDAPWDRIRKDDWLMDNVVRHLPTHSTGQVVKRVGFGESGYSWGGISMSSTKVKPKWVIANEVRDFLLAEPNPELWADYAAYDHVALAQLWGPMIRLPRGLPMFTRDFQQRWHDAGCPELPRQATGEHDALDDARHLRATFEALQAQ